MFLDAQKEIILFLQEYANTVTEVFFSAVSFLGDPEFYILLLGLIYWVLHKRLGEVLAVTLGTSISLNNVLKGILMIDRPFQTYDEVQNLREYGATGSSMPSGHAQGSSTVFFAIARHFNRRNAFIVASVLAVLMMISRMFLGVHYLQDVVAGTAIGILVALIIYSVYDRLESNDTALHLFYFLLILAFFPGVILLADNETANDFFRGYGILTGFAAAIIIEKRFVNFTLAIPWFKKILRYFIGIALMLLVMEVFGRAFEGVEDVARSNVLDFIRFFAVAFIGFGIYPIIFKALRF